MLTGFTVAVAAAFTLTLGLTDGWHVHAPGQFLLLALFVLGGELLPIPVPRHDGLETVTISTAFAFALLLTAGPLPACAVYALASVIADLIGRTAAVKVVFNAAQYVVSLAGAGLVLTVAGTPAIGALQAGAVPEVLLAGVTCLVINHVLAGSAAAVLGDLPVLPYLRRDIAFQAWTAGCILALAPGVVASADASLAYVPLAFVPMLAIYFGGRQASINSHRAVHDLLTDLPNRVMLGERLSGALAGEHPSSTVAVMIVDLDEFKAVNDTLGHEFGDRVLKLVAGRLKEAIGQSGLLARLGGDEFAVLVEDARDPADALVRAQRLLSALERPFEIDSLLLEVNGCVGVACHPAHGQSVQELMRHADVALYCAKAERSTCAVYSEEQDEHSIDRLALAAQLRRGIDRGELIVEYQPKMPLRTDHPLAVEALVRWNHPQLGCIGPDGFVPLAEQTGLIKTLTLRVLEHALRECEAWHAAGLNVRFSVNLSTRSLLDRDLAGSIRGLLDRFAVPPGCLQLEITESRVVTDVGRARKVLEELRTAGVTIAIDDFGTGYSSLSQLQQLPVDEIKIDRSFVIGMETDGDDAILVRSVIELGRSLGLHVTAEGVESERVHRTLRELDCDYVQGYHIGRPMVAAECRRYLEANRQRLAPVRLAAEAGARGAVA
jgi:diguanylate cyclase (GGDEF)-like protein